MQPTSSTTTTATNQAIDNFWQGAWSVANPETYMNGSDATNSPITVRTIPSGYAPANNIGSPIPYSYFPPISINTQNGGLLRSCPALPTAPSCPTCRQAEISLMEKYSKDSVAPIANISETKFQYKMQTYRSLKNDPSYMSSSSDLQSFYANSANTSREKLNDTEDKISEGNFSLAQNDLNNFTTTNQIEQNHKNLMSFAISNNNNGSFSVADSTSLVHLASGCPFTDGIAVYQPIASSDLYNSCSTNQLDVPGNLNGYQFAPDGQGYAGIIAICPSCSPNPWREYAEVRIL